MFSLSTISHCPHLLTTSHPSYQRFTTNFRFFNSLLGFRPSPPFIILRNRAIIIGFFISLFTSPHFSYSIGKIWTCGKGNTTTLKISFIFILSILATIMDICSLSIYCQIPHSLWGFLTSFSKIGCNNFVEFSKATYSLQLKSILKYIAKFLYWGSVNWLGLICCGIDNFQHNFVNFRMSPWFCLE